MAGVRHEKSAERLIANLFYSTVDVKVFDNLSINSYWEISENIEIIKFNFNFFKILFEIFVQ